MRTCKTLVEAQKYLDGTPSYKGDVKRLYSSSLIYSMELSIVKAPDGAKVYASTDGELLQTMRKLKFGQIGAIKTTDDLQVLGTENVVEVVIPVTDKTVLKAKEGILATLDVDSAMAELSCTVQGSPIKLDRLKEQLGKFRDENREIRNRWAQYVKSIKARGLSSEAIKQRKREFYSDYFSLSEYTVTAQVVLWHIVNKPSLKSTVVNNINDNYYKVVNYDESKVRKTARLKLQPVSFPIATLEDYNKVITYLRTSLDRNPNLADLRKMGLEVLWHEGGIFGTEEVDWKTLKELDSSLIVKSR